MKIWLQIGRAPSTQKEELLLGTLVTLGDLAGKADQRGTERLVDTWYPWIFFVSGGPRAGFPE